ncbi:MAG: vWA domain-containing protein, partial [Planctomycetaceae bacterium]
MSRAWQYQTADEQNYFAVALRGSKAADDAAGHNIVILVDTSASQKGDHRLRTMEVLRHTINHFSADDRVQIIAVDVDATSISNGFIPTQGSDIEAAITALNRRVPLGASDLQLGITAAMNSLAGQTNGAIVYFGDGMSTAGLIPYDELAELAQRLRKSELPVHSFAVGPKTDLQLLGTLAQFSGGTVTVDGAVTTSEDA